MATVNSTQYAKLVAKRETGAHDPLIPSEQSGTVRVAHAEYEASGLAIDDVINMFEIPVNARIISGELSHDAMASSTQLSVGYAAHTNAAGAAVALSAAAFKAAASSASATATPTPCFASIALRRNAVGPTAAGTDDAGYVVTVTNTGAAATGTIQLTVQYVVN